MDQQTLIIEALKASPFLAFCGWMVYQMKAAIDRMMDRNEGAAKIVATALERSTEMMGRIIQSTSHTDALTARAIDILDRVSPNHNGKQDKG